MLIPAECSGHVESLMPAESPANHSTCSFIVHMHALMVLAELIDLQDTHGQIARDLGMLNSKEMRQVKASTEFTPLVSSLFGHS